MRSSKKNVLFQGLAVMAVAAPLLAGCKESSPTEPTVVVRGALSGSTLDIALSNSHGTAFGQWHFHR